MIETTKLWPSKNGLKSDWWNIIVHADSFGSVKRFEVCGFFMCEPFLLWVQRSIYIWRKTGCPIDGHVLFLIYQSIWARYGVVRRAHLYILVQMLCSHILSFYGAWISHNFSNEWLANMSPQLRLCLKHGPMDVIDRRPFQGYGWQKVWWSTLIWPRYWPLNLT